jgi:ABC-type transport system involved in cytochrome c biogenesis permease subunit
MSKPKQKNNPAHAPQRQERRGWRVWVSWSIVLLFAVELGLALFLKRADKTFAVSEFATLPLTFNGRVQPMDSLARNSLMQIRGITQVPLEGNGADGKWGAWEELSGDLKERAWYQFDKHPKKLKPTPWLMEVMFDAAKADSRYIFVINHPDVRGLLELDGGVEKSGLHFFRFKDLRPKLDKLQPEIARAGNLKAEQRTPYDRALLQLHNAWSLYMRLKNTLQPEDTDNFAAELDQYMAGATQARAEVQAAQARGEELTDAKLEQMLGPIQRIAGRYDAMARMEPPLVIPPQTHGDHDHGWQRTGEALLEAPRGGLAESVRHYAAMSVAYRAGDHAKFNRALGTYRASMEKLGLVKELKKGAWEEFFNRMLAFKRSMYVYIVAFLLILLYWANLTNIWRITAVRLIGLGFVVHTAGLIFRMVLEGRPPVTNLYSSAIFIGWGAVVLGLVMELIFRNGIGAIVAAAVGFLSLVVAHNLSLGGDTMEMMRAVLDTNFWLATHVVIITLGYASTFVAGFLGLIYVGLGLFTKRLASKLSSELGTAIGMAAGLVAGGVAGAIVGGVAGKKSAQLGDDFGKTLTRMVYAIVCFATLFSFVGTVLGGIWADQSWGRFWGWDPKENGALIIVLWNALILHARWGGLVKERGLMNLAIIGNIVTSWSWFGTNMLGIGLHSYGFMDAAFNWLLLFVGSQCVLVSLGLVPLAGWRSFTTTATASGAAKVRHLCVTLGVVLLGAHVLAMYQGNSTWAFRLFLGELLFLFGMLLFNLLQPGAAPVSGKPAPVTPKLAST